MGVRREIAVVDPETSALHAAIAEAQQAFRINAQDGQTDNGSNTEAVVEQTDVQQQTNGS